MPMLPFFEGPVMFRSSRDPGMCDMTPEQCAYKSRYWVFWYEADHRYGLPTIAFLLSTILLFSLFNVFSFVAPEGVTKSKSWRQVVSVGRWASYRRWRIGGWNSQSLGTYMLGAIGFVFFTTMTLAAKPYYWPDMSYGHSPPIATRAGWMALACLPFILILGTKANLVATLLGTSHENLVVWHNWIAWAMFVLALIHTFPFVVQGIQMGTIVADWNEGGLWVTGVVALIAQAWLTFMSIRWIRERFYEFFKATHFIAAMAFVVFFFLHCQYTLTSWDYFIAAGVLYSLSWFYSQFRTYMEHGIRHRARLTLETGEMLKISIDTHAEWTPGQHIYLRFLTQGVHALTAHPFTICSLPGAKEGGRSQMVFYVRARGGLTQRLASLAEKTPGASVPVLLDGPYGGVKGRWYDGFDHTLVIGGGAGAGFSLSLAQDFLTRSRRRRRQTPNAKMTLVVSSRDPGLRRWYLEAVSEMVAAWEERNSKDDDMKTSGLTVHIHETGSAQLSESNSDRESTGKIGHGDKENSRTGHEGLYAVETGVYDGRPDLPALGRDAVAMDGASVGMVVCGPASMVHDVGKIAAEAQSGCIKGGKGASEVWFHKESFS